MKVLSKVNPVFVFTLYLPAVLIVLGASVLLFLVALPYFNIELSQVMASPIVPQSVRRNSGFGEFSFEEISHEASPSSVVKNLPATFTLAVPKLGIKNAKVETNSTNLDPKNLLGHYRGTALPGEPGNSFIYGHSVLPIFFNPKDYKTIFSTLPRLNEGDTFEINFGGTTYFYEVVAKLNLKPEEVDVFDPNPARLIDGTSTVTLMTCVPPGSKTYRLLVVGKLLSN